MAEKKDERASREYAVAVFWDTGLGFWRRGGGTTAWALTIGVIAVTVVNLGVQYLINAWHRGMFDAIEHKDAAAVLRQSLIFLPLTVANVALAVAAVWTRLTTQRAWRAWFNGQLLDRWLNKGRYYQLNFVAGEHQNPEYRIADDLRVACDALIDFAVGIMNAVLSALMFIGVLWFIGGAATVTVGGRTLMIPGFLVVAAVLYAAIASGAMVRIGHGFVDVTENKNQAEAEYRYGLTRLRENGESIALLGGEAEERAGLDTSFGTVLERWRDVLWQWMRTQVVSQTSSAFVPVLPLILCAPKYVAGTMTLGEVMQATAAFVTVQISFNWVVDNYPRLAEWTASARRVGSLLASLQRLDRADVEGGSGRIAHSETDQAALHLKEVAVTLDDGSAVVQEADVEIARGEKVLVVGESGVGKSTLVRAMSGLWPWGSGEIQIQRGAKLLLIPQQTYVPLGTLRRAAAYPSSPEEVDDKAVRQALEDVGLGHFLERIDEDTRWAGILSGGEKQRLSFARLLIHRPDLVIMDEATAALDPQSQEHLMKMFLERLPEATLISVGHREELEAFHTRKLVLEYHAEGACLVKDESLVGGFRRSARVLSRVLSRERPARRAASA